jgi:hypothetical protein
VRDYVVLPLPNTDCLQQVEDNVRFGKSIIFFFRPSQQSTEINNALLLLYTEDINDIMKEENDGLAKPDIIFHLLKAVGIW